MNGGDMKVFRGAAVLLLVVLALVVPAAASARVRLIYLTSPVRPGQHAILVAAVSPARTCSITVLYRSGPSGARGLSAKRPQGGKVAWTWLVNASPGRWPIRVNCGSAGILRTSFVVR
jgi:hypothetical protein